MHENMKIEVEYKGKPLVVNEGYIIYGVIIVISDDFVFTKPILSLDIPLSILVGEAMEASYSHSYKKTRKLSNVW